ncbi:MAG: radical SAM protein [Candidatus Alcyoniella australis]|nr:radical SAM protein [Candidatus Alcyoniella australis]
MSRDRLLLLNPPADRPTMRDYYCSSSSKGRTVWQPLDLVVQSGWLRGARELTLIDAAISGQTAQKVLREIERLKPQATLGLIGAAALDSDVQFYNELGAAAGRLFLSGDVARFRPQEVFTAIPTAEGILRDLASDGLARRLADEEPGQGLWLRGGPLDDGPLKGEFRYPLPLHELFWPLPYRHPFLGWPFASLLTDHGCPFGCAFCNSGRPGWMQREPDDLFAELEALAERGLRWLFIKDMTFNADPKRCADLLQRMIAGNYGFRFAAYLRPDRIDDGLARLLRKAGCVVAQLGIESGSDELLAGQGKGIDLAAIRRGCAQLDRAGVPIGGHFVVGLPGESDAQRAATLRLALELPLVYASFNLATPRYGSRLEPGGGLEQMDGSHAVQPMLPQVLEFVRRANRRFYLRPRTWRRAAATSPAGARGLLRGGLALLTGKGA